MTGEEKNALSPRADAFAKLAAQVLGPKPA